MKQVNRESNVDYIERFKNRLTVVSACGANLLFKGILDYTAQALLQVRYLDLDPINDAANILTVRASAK